MTTHEIDLWSERGVSHDAIRAGLWQRSETDCLTATKGRGFNPQILMKKYTYETCVLSNIPHNESMQRQLHDIANALSLFTGAKVTWICRDETNGFFRVETDELPHHTMEIGEHWDALHK